ncbi:MAG TPA: immunoglobulin domain-containing protein [Verrucomicrobiae bacterium]|nr:immunoglobulin domain-containing protein [Verrucomicrobiae bacterium]
MEATRQPKWSWLQKTLIFLVFGLFNTANVEAQGLLPPSITVSPSSTNVQNGDTVTFNVSAYCVVGVLTSVTWQYSGGAFPTNAAVTTSGGILNVNSSINSTLTINNASSACAGTYTVTVSDAGGLLGILVGNSSASVNLSVPATVSAVAAASKMVEKGFKIQFSAPTGSNLVIEATSDMAHWTSVCTNKVTGGSVTYTDAVAKTVSSRFYRARLK